MVTASAVPDSRISSGSSAATVSGRVVCTDPRIRNTGVRLVTRPTPSNATAPYGSRMEPLPPYTAVVLAGGRAVRLGGRAKPQLEVGGRAMLATVLDAVADAADRIVVGPRQPVPDDVLLVREEPPGGGPVAALRTGLAEVSTEVVAVLAGDLPFLTAALIGQLRERLTGRRHPGHRRRRPRPVAARRLADRRAACRRERHQRPDVAAEGAGAAVAPAPASGRRAGAAAAVAGLRHPRRPRPRPRCRRHTGAAPTRHRRHPATPRPAPQPAEPSVWPLFRSPGEG